jgi:hypothetical protein
MPIATDQLGYILKCILYEMQPFRLIDVFNMCSFFVSLAKDLGVLGFSFADYLYLWFFEFVSSVNPSHWIYFGIWCICLGIMTHLEFGSLWILVTMFALIFLNLGTRKKGELSAYSVFNAGFKQLLGTTTAEQFDKEIRHNIPHRRGNLAEEENAAPATAVPGANWDDGEREGRPFRRRGLPLLAHRRRHRGNTGGAAAAGGGGGEGLQLGYGLNVGDGENVVQLDDLLTAQWAVDMEEGSGEEGERERERGASSSGGSCDADFESRMNYRGRYKGAKGAVGESVGYEYAYSDADSDSDSCSESGTHKGNNRVLKQKSKTNKQKKKKGKRNGVVK